MLPLGKDTFCDTTQAICWYPDNMEGKALDSASMMGNFEAFAALKPNKDSTRSLSKVISVGGYGHDATFEETIASPVYIDNFVNSAKAIITNYNLDGIDLDFEAPTITPTQATEFASLVTQLRTALPGKLITLTILSGPSHIDQFKGSWKKLYDAVNYINLMTYDFHGAFDYAGGQGKTGFITNLAKPDDAPVDYKFSVEDSVDDLEADLKSEGVTSPTSKIVVGIPAYGRSLQGISSTNHGLYQTMADAPIPKGDLDSGNCSQDITNISPSTCSGSFQYKYIMKNMVASANDPDKTDHTFTATDWAAQGISNGTTAYASTWAPPIVPKVFAYYEGWIAPAIPDMSFNGVILSFALLKGTYYTTYPGDFELPGAAYNQWKAWSNKWRVTSGNGLAMLSYGGGTNPEFRPAVINATDAQLSQIAGELKANMDKCHFDGIDIDIEQWWDYSLKQNTVFAQHLATLVKDLKSGLVTSGEGNKLITIAVGADAAGYPLNASYDGSMKPFFSDTEAMQDTNYINIMSYGFPSLDKAEKILDTFVQAGVVKSKLLYGLDTNSSTSQINALDAFLKQNHYGGMFLWAIGQSDLSSATAHLQVMKSSLGI